jgi:hypothetical protein
MIVVENSYLIVISYPTVFWCPLCILLLSLSYLIIPVSSDNDSIWFYEINILDYTNEWEHIIFMSMSGLLHL